MKIDEVKRVLRQNVTNLNTDLKKDLQQYLPYLNKEESIQVLTECAMLATRHGILSHLKLLIQQNHNILKEKQCGIFRVSAEIDNIEEFKQITDYLFKKNNRQLIDVNALDSGFLKECIKRKKLEYIQYLIENKQINFDLKNNNLIKTVLRYESMDILNYLIIDLKVVIESDDVKAYMLQNSHNEALDKINKCNMFIKLGQKLENKNTHIKVRKI